MSFQRKKVAAALAYLAGAGGALSLSAAFAQAVNPDVPSLTRQPAPDIRVEVTGSNIRRVEGEGSLPVTVITRQQIEQSGATTPMELLQQISANNSAGALNLANAVGATTFSAQVASLRGLGPNRTLVLINGHRLESFAGAIQGVEGGANLAGIPFSAIERVEVLKDGASAVYGSDAIGGVINFITRSDYVGAEVTGFYGSPTRSGGGQQWQGQASAGWGDLAKDRWNVFVSGSYNEQRPLDQADREFSNTSYRPDIGLAAISSNTNPGNVRTRGTAGSELGRGRLGVLTDRGGVVHQAVNQADCGVNLFVNDDILGTGCVFDPARVPGINMIAHDKTYNLFGSGKFQINADWQAYLQGRYSHDENNLVIQPGPLSEVFPYGPAKQTDGTILLQPTSPFYPHQIAAAAGIDGTPLDVRYRTFDNGGRDTTDTNESWNVVGGVKGSWMNWDWDANAYYNEGKTKERLSAGFQDLRLMYPILQSGVVNFFGANTPDVIALERTANFVGDIFNGTSKSYGAQAKTSGEIWKLPAGPLAMAFGLETRKEELSQVNPEPLQTGNVSGFGGEIKDVSGSRRQYAAFTEFNIPIVRTLEGNAQVRYDHYSDFGSTTNPKFSLRWQPTRTLLLRGSYGTGFLAPSLYELNTPNISGVSATGVTDPIRCPITGDTGFDCQTQFGVTFGGNKNLKPEESEQTTLGIVLEPIPNASFSVDWFKINLKNAIVNGISPLVITGDLAQFGGFVTRAAPDPAFPNLPGRIINIDQRYINLGSERIEGFDIEGHYRAPAMSWGRLSVDLSGTYYTKYDVQQTDGSFQSSVCITFGSVVTGVIPRWKQYIALNWALGPWAATLANTYQTSYRDAQNSDNLIADDAVGVVPHKVGALSLWDLQTTYSGFKNLKLTLGVKNLFDTNPPVSNQQGTFIVGFDPSYYDPRARFVYGSVTYTFK
jgi:iron complex outermembrane receptor protein